MAAVTMRVLIDADVLWSRTLRDWILLMSDSQNEKSPYSVFWTEDILAETVARIRDKRPDLPSGAVEVIGERLRGEWARNRISRFQPMPETFMGQDEGDLHVHSAAVAGDIDIVVTNDVTGLIPASDPEDPSKRDRLLELLPYEVYSADDFLVLVAKQAPEVVKDCTQRQVDHYLDHGKDVNLVDNLSCAQAKEFSDEIRWVLQSIDLRPR